MRKLRADLVRDIMEQVGLSAPHAVHVVSQNLVGWRESKGGQVSKVLTASPEARRLLELKTKESAAVPEVGWKSGNQLYKEYRGSCSTLAAKLKNIREILINDITDQVALSRSEATAIVDSFLVGNRAYGGGVG